MKLVFLNGFWISLDHAHLAYPLHVWNWSSNLHGAFANHSCFQSNPNAVIQRVGEDITKMLYDKTWQDCPLIHGCSANIPLQKDHISTTSFLKVKQDSPWCTENLSASSVTNWKIDRRYCWSCAQNIQCGRTSSNLHQVWVPQSLSKAQHKSLASRRTWSQGSTWIQFSSSVLACEVCINTSSLLSSHYSV